MVDTTIQGEQIGSVISMTGSVWAVNGADQRLLTEGSPVFEGEEIITESDSNVEIKFSDDTVLGQGEDSAVRLDDYVFTEEDNQLDFHMVKGVMRVVSGEIVKANPEGFNLSTPLATIGIRGTEVMIQVDQGREFIGVDQLGEGHTVLIGNAFNQIVIDKAGMFSGVDFDGSLIAPDEMPTSFIQSIVQAAPLTILGDSPREPGTPQDIIPPDFYETIDNQTGEYQPGVGMEYAEEDNDEEEFDEEEFELSEEEIEALLELETAAGPGVGPGAGTGEAEEFDPVVNVTYDPYGNETDSNEGEGVQFGAQGDQPEDTPTGDDDIIDDTATPPAEPVVIEQSAASENEPVTFNVLTNEPEGSSLVNADTVEAEVTETDETHDGELEFETEGDITYTPAPGEDGTVVIEYTIQDSDGDTTTSQVSFTLAPDSEPEIEVEDVTGVEAAGVVTVTGTLSADFGADSEGSSIELTADGASWNTETNTLSAADGSWDIELTDGGYVFTQSAPMAEAEGTAAGEEFTVNVTATATDSDGDVATGDFSITLTDSGPVASDIVLTEVVEDTTVNYNVFDSGDADTGLYGGELTEATIAEDSEVQGEVGFDSDGNITFTPEHDASGTATINYTVTDSDGDTATAQFTINVEPAEDHDVEQSETSENEPITINVLTDEPEGSTLVDADMVVSETPETDEPQGGDLEFEAEGDITYTPAPGEEGTVVIEFTVEDSDGDSRTSQVSITLAPDSEPVIETFDATGVEEAGVVTVTGTITTDFGADSEGSSIELSADGAHWDSYYKILVASDGSWDIELTDDGYVFTQNSPMVEAVNTAAGEEFTVNVTATATDSDGDVATGDFSIALTDSGPIASDITLTEVLEDTSVTYNVFDSGDADTGLFGGELTDATLAEDSEIEGEVGFDSDGNITFTPAADASGTATIDYTVTDSDGDTATAQVTIDVEPVNDTPEADDQSFTFTEDTSFTITEDTLLEGARDVDVDALSVTSVVGTNLPGELVDNEDGTWTFTPEDNWNGDLSLAYTVSDGTAETVAAINLTVSDDMTDLVSTSTEDVVETTVTTDSAVTDVDTTVTSDTVRDAETGDFVTTTTTSTDTETTTTETTTTDTTPITTNVFEDGSEQVVTGDTVTTTDTDVTVTTDTTSEDVVTVEANAVPTAEDQTDSFTEDTTFTITSEMLLEGATDADDDTLTVASVSGTDLNGELTDNEDGTWTYAPAEDWNGVVELTYTVTDGFVESDPASITLTVNDDMTDLVSSTTEDSVETTVTTDSEVTGVDTTVTSDTVRDAETGDFVTTTTTTTDTETTTTETTTTDTTPITTNVFEDGSEQVLFGETVTTTDTDVTVTTDTTSEDVITVDPNAIPTAEAKSGSFTEDTVFTITAATLLAGAADADDDTLSVASVSGTDLNGVLTDNEDGTWTYAPDANWNGEVELTYTVTDGFVESEPASITLTVNDDMTDLVSSTTEDSVETTITMDSAVTGVDTTVTSDTVRDAETGDFVTTTTTTTDTETTTTETTTTETTPVTTNVFEDGSEQVVFGETATTTDTDVTVTTDTTSEDVITIDPNAAPTVADGTYTVEEGGSITFTEDELLANASDADTDPLSVVSVSAAGLDGELESDGEGSWTFTPDEGVTGELTLTYTVSDGYVETEADINLTVEAVPDEEPTNLLVNGDFSDVTAAVGDTWIAANASSVDGWDAGRFYSSSSEAPRNIKVGEGNAKIEVWQAGFNGVLDPDGNDEGYFVEIDYAGATDYISQTVATEAGVEYLMSFDATVRPDSTEGETLIVQVWSDGAIIQEETFSPDRYDTEAQEGWSQFTLAFTADSDETTVVFTEPEYHDDGNEKNTYGVLLDNVSLTVDPEYDPDAYYEEDSSEGDDYDVDVYYAGEDYYDAPTEDQATVFGTSDEDEITGSQGNDAIFGDAGEDTLEGGQGMDYLHGGADDDILIGGQGDDVLIGDNDEDELDGGHGEDVLVGGPGDDELYGGKGDDVLIGGAGEDELTGGKGSDTFVFTSLDSDDADTITDFNTASDQISLFEETFQLASENGTVDEDQFIHLTTDDELPPGGYDFENATTGLIYLSDVGENTGALFYDPNDQISGDEVLITNIEFSEDSDTDEITAADIDVT